MNTATTTNTVKFKGKFQNGLECKIKSKSNSKNVSLLIQAKFLNRYWRTIETINKPIYNGYKYAEALRDCISEAEQKYSLNLTNKA